MMPFPFGQFTKKQMDKVLKEIKEQKRLVKRIKEQQKVFDSRLSPDIADCISKNCEHPLNEIVLERNYYGPDEDSDYTHYFRCDKCGEEIETEEGE